jgi:transcriptional regulator with XRE-family HTH domain
MNDRPAPPAEGELITRALKAKKLSVREAARRAGISEGWWRQIVKGYQSLSGGGYGPVRGPAETLARMAKVVDVTPEQLTKVGRNDAATELRKLGERPDIAPDDLDELMQDPEMRDLVERLLAGDLSAIMENAELMAAWQRVRRRIQRHAGGEEPPPPPADTKRDEKAG